MRTSPTTPEHASDITTICAFTFAPIAPKRGRYGWQLTLKIRDNAAMRCSGYGDPVCVDTESAGRVFYLLHDRDMTPRFMNSLIPQLAYSLLAFRQVVAVTNAIGGKGAYLEGRIPPEVVDRFITQMETIDPPAISSEHFWFHSIVGEGV